MSDDEYSKLEYNVPGLPKPINLDETERRIGNTEKEDTDFYLQQKEAQETYQRLTDATLAEGEHDAYNTFLSADKRKELTSADEYMLSDTPKSNYSDSYDKLMSEEKGTEDINDKVEVPQNDIQEEIDNEVIEVPQNDVQEEVDNEIIEVPQNDINEVIEGPNDIEEIYDPTCEFKENADDITFDESIDINDMYSENASDITESSFDENQDSNDIIDPSTEFKENNDDITFDESIDINDLYAENAADITELNENTTKPDTYDHNYDPPMP